MRYKTVALLGFWCIGTAASSAQVVEFKGLPLGVDKAAVGEWVSANGLKCGTAARSYCLLVPQQSCDSIPLAASQTSTYVDCLRETGAKRRFANIALLSLLFITAQESGALESVTGTFATAQHAAMLAALVEKYGPPTTTESTPWQNKAGAVFENSVVTWWRQDGVIVLRARTDDRDVASLNMYATGVLEAREAKTKAATKRAVSDM